VNALPKAFDLIFIAPQGSVSLSQDPIVKILIVTQYFWPENFRINDLVLGLIERGHQVDVYTGLPNYPQGRFFDGYGLGGPYHQRYHDKINVIRCPLIPRGQKKGIQLFLNYFSFAFLASLLAPFLVRKKYDCIFVYQLSPVSAGLPAVILKFFKKIPIYFWVTDLWPESLKATGAVKSKTIIELVAKFVRFLYSQSDVILVSSKGFINKIVAQHVPLSKIHYWPQWAENLFLTKIEHDDEKIKSEIPAGFRVMFAGNIGTAQSFETIIEAAIILKDRPEIQWIVLGDGLQRPWAEEQKIKHGLKNFHLLGTRPIEKMPQYFHYADVLLASLKKDPLFAITVPGKIQAYMASGKPLIVSMDGEGAELVKESGCGIACEANNAQELAEAVLKMYSFSSEKRSEMGNMAHSFFLDNFEREKLLSKLENLMQQ